jgi:hypothetical protein
MDPYTEPDPSPADWEHSMEDIGVGIAATLLARLNAKSGHICNAIGVACQRERWAVLALDVLRTLCELGLEYTGPDAIFEGVYLPEMRLGYDVTSLDSFTFKDSFIGTLELPRDADINLLPRFKECYVGTVLGRSSENDLPLGRFSDCEFDEFEEETSTTAGIMDSTLPLLARVKLSLLKKVYLQPGRGRKDSAMSRGLDHRAKSLVPTALASLQSAGLLVPTRRRGDTIWLPARSAQGRVARMIAAPTQSKDPVLAEDQ